jgi:immune inhibitor A
MKMGRIVVLLAVGLLAVSGFAPQASAMPPTKNVIDRMIAEGTFDEHIAQNASAHRRGVDQPDRLGLAANGSAAITGNLNVLVLLVEFSDNQASAGGSFSDTAYFNNLLFSTNAPGYSMNDHYVEMSYGLVNITGLTVNWETMPQTYAYYVDGQRGFGNYPKNAQKMAEDAVDAAEAAGVDFSQYDNDGDGSMDGLFIVHAGPGYEATGNVNQIHSHQWGLGSARFYDGVTISVYTMEPEEQGSGEPINVGVFSHEYGHFLGLPDLYDTDYTSRGVGRWCLMAGGSWNDGGDTPAHMSVWCKYKLGWVNPVNVTSNMVGASIPQIETDSVAYRLWAGGSFGNEYFLIENRQRLGFDLHLPHEGVLIWHIDDNKFGNTQEWYPGLPTSQHSLVALEQADGDWDMEHDSNSGDPADPWPGTTNNTEFSEFSTPDSKRYNQTSTQTAVWNISASDSDMTANLDVFFSQPFFGLEGSSFTDDGNSDGRPDPGENVSMTVSQRNLGAPVTDAAFSVTTSNPAITFTDSTATIGAVGTGVLVSNAGDPFDFNVPSNFIPAIVDFYVTVTADGGSYLKIDTIKINIGADQILLVDDDARLSHLQSYDSAYIMPALDSLQVPYATWEVESQGTPTNMGDYPCVIWYTGDRRTSASDTILTASERTAMANYLDSGGHLWLTGQQIARRLDVVDSAFMHNYLHATYAGPFNDFIARGLDGDVVGDQTSYVLGGAGGAANQQEKDLLVPKNGAVPAFSEEVNAANIAGIRYDGAYKLLFLGWGVEGIGDDIAYLFDADAKAVLIDRAVNWLVYNSVFTGISLQPLAVNPGQDQTHLMDTAIDMYWSFNNPLSDPQDSVEIQVGSNADWAVAEYMSVAPTATADTTMHYVGPTPVSGNTYFWRVRVFTSGEWSGWSNSSWHMNAAPAAPNLSSPVANNIATQNGPLLTTAKAADAENDICVYDFQVYDDSLFTTLLASATDVPGGGSLISWTVDVQLTEQGRAWWRARASDGLLEGPWSSAASFYVDGINEAPTAPALDSPSDSAGLFSSDLDLAWSGATDPDLIDALLYQVDVDTQANFATATTYDSLASETLFAAGVLSPAQRYYWRVTVFDKGSLDATSVVYTFINLLAGDVNGDATVSSADIVTLVNLVFKGAPPPDPPAVADVDASCAITSADIIYMVNYVFKSGPTPQIGCAI